MTNTKNSFTRFAAAAKDCFYVNSFRADLVQCDRALKMDGEMRVEAECWMNILDALDDNDIKMYVDNVRWIEPALVLTNSKNEADAAIVRNVKGA